MTINFNGMNPYTQMYAYQNLGADAPLLSAGTAMGVPSFCGGMYNPQMYMNNMAQWDKFGVQRQVDTFQSQNNAQFKMASQTNRISKQIQVLNERVQENDQNQIHEEYEKLVQAVKDTYGTQLTQGLPENQAELQVKAYAENLYAQQTGTVLSDEVRKKGDNSFVSGVKQVLTLGFGNRITSEENAANIQGSNLAKDESAKKTAGKVAGGVLGALAIGSVIKNSRVIGKAILGVLKYFTKIR